VEINSLGLKSMHVFKYLNLPREVLHHHARFYRKHVTVWKSMTKQTDRHTLFFMNIGDKRLCVLAILTGRLKGMKRMGKIGVDVRIILN
jgi:hypothetical protein